MPRSRPSRATDARDAPGGELVLRSAGITGDCRCANTWRECEADPKIRAIVPQTDQASSWRAPVVFVNQKRRRVRGATWSWRRQHAEARVPPRAEGQVRASSWSSTTIDDRDVARDLLLGRRASRFRTGKTLVPFRITGNIDWGVKAPALEDGMEGLTVWCWPESLWAPISFTHGGAGRSEACRDEAWKRVLVRRRMPRSTSSSARITSTSTAWRSRRCGWPRRPGDAGEMPAVRRTACSRAV